MAYHLVPPAAGTRSASNLLLGPALCQSGKGLMDFLQEAQRWAAGLAATGANGAANGAASGPPEIAASPPPPVRLSRSPQHTLPPRTLNEAITRAVQSEARALALQTALDRYAAQGEVMEVRCGRVLLTGSSPPQIGTSPSHALAPFAPRHTCDSGSAKWRR